MKRNFGENTMRKSKNGTIKNKILFLMALLLMLASCSTTKVIEPFLDIPDITLIRPERPTLTVSDTPDMLTVMMNDLTLMDYSNRMENYADGLEEYIQKIREIISR